MPTKYLAITIAGAVSLGSYEAGATYEILDAIRQHNQHPDTIVNGDFIRIDVLTGASAGGMTAAIVSQKLLYAKDDFVDAYNNPLYNCWVKGISLAGLLNTEDKPLPDGDPALLSLLSSNLIKQISKNTLAQQDENGQIPQNGGAHNAIDPDRGIRLGLALTNLNGINYSYQLFGGGQFLYTDFSDQMLRSFSAADRSFAPWKEISEAAVACGAFPVAFRTKDLVRSQADYEPSDTLVAFPTDPYTFTYTDGGVLQNQPLGMAKNLVDKNDKHLATENRFYLFASPSAMLGEQNLELTEASANMLTVGKRLVDIYMGQSVFRDWINSQKINDQIDLLDQRARGLADALIAGTIDPAVLSAASQQVLTLLYAGADPTETQQQAEDRLAIQYAAEIGTAGDAKTLGGLDTDLAVAFLHGILALEKTANLGEKDKMRIYGVVADKSKLAGEGVSAFVGFFDQAFRDHDYDYGRTIAQKLLANPAFQQPGELGPIRYTPSAIRAIDPALTGLHLKDIPKADIATLKDGLTHRLNQILRDKLSNPLERYPAQLGADIALGLVLDWEFNRDIQG